MRPGCGRVHPGTLGTLECALGDVRFIRGRCVQWGTTLWASCASWATGLTRVLPGCRRVHPFSLGSMECALGFVGFISGR